MSSFRAIAEGKCPQCRSGLMFKFPITDVKRFNVMHQNCPCCNLAFSVEPGFFIGAMYISYAAVVGLVIVIGFTLMLLFKCTPLWVYAVIITSAVLLFLPLIFRYSRILYLHLFGGISYNSVQETKNC